MWIFPLFLLLTLSTSQYACGPHNSTQTFSKGDEIPVCLHFSTQEKIVFLPRLDVYSAVQAKGAYQYFNTTLINARELVDNTTITNNSTDTGGTGTENGTDAGNGTGGTVITTVNPTEILVAVQAQGTNMTVWVPYLTNTLVAKVYSVVVHLSDGKAESVEWDNSCSVCSTDCLSSPDTSTEEICGEPHCPALPGEDCDPRLYVTWMGKDKNGLNLDSAGYRISSFRKYSLYDTYSEAKQNF